MHQVHPRVQAVRQSTWKEVREDSQTMLTTPIFLKPGRWTHPGLLMLPAMHPERSRRDPLKYPVTVSRQLVWISDSYASYNNKKRPYSDTIEVFATVILLYASRSAGREQSFGHYAASSKLESKQTLPARHYY